MSIVKHHKLKTEKTGHIYSIANPQAFRHWMLCHGYAMTAEQIVHKFKDLDEDNNFYYAPEALSSFYYESDIQNIPVASWMTSRHRLDEIADYSHYLNTCLNYFSKNVSRVLFGFSQGATTLWRFINAIKPDFDIFINWAGDIPDNTEYDTDYLKGKKLIYVYGDNDKYLSLERIDNLKWRCQKLELDVFFHSFKGEHRVDRKYLRMIYERHVKTHKI
jgi:dienelactone hydrolase